jgi:hypothetical protein
MGNVRLNIRPLNHINTISQLFPGIWKQVDSFRQGRGKDLPDWPAWCFLPMAASMAIATQGQTPTLEAVGDVAKLAAMIPWRYTQGVYKFEPQVYQCISNTVAKGDIPVEVLHRLPEWSVYIETPELDEYGFFAHLEYDIKIHRHELRILMDGEDELWPIILHLGNWTVTEAIDRALSESAKNGEFNKYDMPVEQLITHISAIAHHCISLLLYLCSEQPDIERIENELPKRAKPTKTKKGFKLFPPKKPKIWHVGRELEKQIKQTQKSKHETGNRNSPKAHIRRAHWHGYWRGSHDTDSRKFIYKWLPPLLINSSGTE